MSQSSTSSTNSRKNLNRKRKTFDSSPSSQLGLGQKKRVSRLSLKHKAFDDRIPAAESPKCKKSSIMDESTNESSCSTSVTSSSVQNKNFVPNYAAIAIKFQINQVAAKKHFSVLTSNPKVHVVWVDPNRLEFKEPESTLPETLQLSNRPLSPVLGSKTKRKRSRKLLKIKEEPVDLYATPVENDSLFKALNIENFLKSVKNSENQEKNSCLSQESSQMNSQTNSNREEVQKNSSVDHVEVVANPFSKKRGKRPQSDKCSNNNNEVNSESRIDTQAKKFKVNAVSEIDSMSVNFTPCFSCKDIEIENSGDKNHLNRPLSFGKTSFHENENNQNEMNHVLSNIDLNKADSTNNLAKINQEIACTADSENPLVIQENSDGENFSNKSFTIRELFDSSPNIDDVSSPEKISVRNSISSNESLSKPKAIKIMNYVDLPRNSINFTGKTNVNDEISLKAQKNNQTVSCNGLEQSIGDEATKKKSDTTIKDVNGSCFPDTNDAINNTAPLDDFIVSWNPSEILEKLDSEVNIVSDNVAEKNLNSSSDGIVPNNVSSTAVQANSDKSKDFVLMNQNSTNDVKLDKNHLKNKEANDTPTGSETLSFEKKSSTLEKQPEDKLDLVNEVSVNHKQLEIDAENSTVDESLDFLIKDLEKVSDIENTTLPKNKSEVKTSQEESSSDRSKSPILSRRIRSSRKSLSQTPSTPLGQRKSIRNKKLKLNKSVSPSKSDNTSPAKKIIEPWNSFVTPDTISLMEVQESSLEKIVDPRLRKRKQREEVEQALKLCDTLLSPEKKNKLSGVDTLGEKTSLKSPSPTKKELRNVIKEAEHYQSEDEDELFLHPDERFSDEDSEPEEQRTRHSKFTSERNNLSGCQNQNNLKDQREENCKTGLSSISPAIKRDTSTLVTKNLQVNANSIRNPMYNRLGLKPELKNNAKTTLESKLGPHPALASRLGPLPNNAASNRIGLNRIASTPNDPVQTNTNSITSRLGVKSRFAPRKTIQIIEAPVASKGLKETEVHIIDQVVQKVIDQPEESYVTYSETGNSDQFDHMSMLDRPVPIKVGMTSARETNFFRNYCFRILRTGNCGNENNGNCTFSHQVTFLQRLIKQKKADLLPKILDFAIEREFAYFLKKVWSSILPTLKEESFNYFEKLYSAKFYSRNIIHELMEFCLNSKLHTVESFAKKIATKITVGDKQLVKDICQEIKPKIRDGFCWETIKNLCERAVPPPDMVELSILQCISRKKSKSHLDEIFHLVKDKMNRQERSELEQDLLKRFYNLISNSVSPAERESLTTLPLPNGNFNGCASVGSASPIQVIKKPSTSSVHSLENKKPQNLTNQPLKSTKITGTVQFPDHTIQQPHSSPNDFHSSPLQAVIHDPKKGESQNFDEYAPHRLDHSGPPTFANEHYRKRFWKLSLVVDSIGKGLEHGDYAHVWKSIDEFSKENMENELLKRAYFHIICKNVKFCERHISEIIRQAGNENYDFIEYLKNYDNIIDD